MQFLATQKKHDGTLQTPKISNIMLEVPRKFLYGLSSPSCTENFMNRS